MKYIAKDCYHHEVNEKAHRVNTIKYWTLYVKESVGMRILDSACTKTVTSKVWLNAFLML